MKLVKSIIAASVLGLCLNAQSMELVNAARKHPYIAAGLAGSALYNAYQVTGKVNDILKKNSLTSKNSKVLRDMYDLAKAVNTMVTKVKGKDLKTLAALEEVAVFLAQELPGLSKQCLLMIANAKIVLEALPNGNQNAFVAYNKAYAGLMKELRPMVKWTIFESIQNASANTVAFIGHLAHKYPTLTTGLGLSGLVAYQYNKGLSNGLNQWVSQNAGQRMAHMTQAVSSNKVLYGVGAGITAATLLAMATFNRLLTGE